MPPNLGKPSEGGKIATLEGKRLILGILSALQKKKKKKIPGVATSSRQKVPDRGGNTDPGTGDTWVPGALARGGARGL